MKVRLGFVSNSSSSSFIMLVTEEDYKAVYEGLNSIEKKVMDYLVKDGGNFAGHKIKKFSTYSGDGYGTWDECSVELTEEEQQKLVDADKYEDEYNDWLLDDVFNKVCKKFKNKITHSEYM
jgi:hypothetical protein